MKQAKNGRILFDSDIPTPTHIYILDIHHTVENIKRIFFHIFVFVRQHCVIFINYNNFWGKAENIINFHIFSRFW
jgi:hypothetical protein